MNTKSKLTFLLVGILSIVSGCGGNGGKCSDDNSDSLKIKEPKKPIEAVTELKPERPQSALFIMDISKSMIGYFGSGDSRLLGVVNSYLNLSTSDPIIHWYGVKEIPGVQKKDFVNITKEDIEWSDESDITAMLQSMISQSGKYNLTILLTDGILSGSNKQIVNSKDRKFNIEKREWMAGEIGKLFQGRDSLAALVVMYEATFYGKYSCYNNDSRTLNEKTRPYYMFIIGQWQYVKYVEGQLSNENSSILNKPYKYYAFFGDERTYEKINFSYKSGIKGVENGKHIIKTEAKKDNGVVEFTSDVSMLPNYMKSQDYWNKNLRLFVQEERKPEKVLISESYSVSIDTISNNKIICTLSIIASKLSRRNLNIKLQYSAPEWIDKYSDDDDLDILVNPSDINKTFNLKYLMNGFTEFQDSILVSNQTIEFK